MMQVALARTVYARNADHVRMFYKTNPYHLFFFNRFTQPLLCTTGGHHYDTIYQQRLGPFSRDDIEPFQFLEVGFYKGGGYDTVSLCYLYHTTSILFPLFS